MLLGKLHLCLHKTHIWLESSNGQANRKGDHRLSCMRECKTGLVCDCIRFLLLLQQVTTQWVAEKNTHSLSYSSVAQKSDLDHSGLKLRHWQACVPSGNSRRESITCLSPPLETACIPWLTAPPPPLKAAAQHLSALLPLLSLALVITVTPPGCSRTLFLVQGDQ